MDINKSKIQNTRHHTEMIPSPQEFFNQVIALNEVLEVHQACNRLLDAMAESYSISTISRKLTDYKRPFYNYQHSNPDLNETVETKKGTNTQHIAARLLTLSDEQKQALGVDRQERDNARAGFDKDGDRREVEKPPIDITAVIKKSLECLDSVDPHTIGAGIINLTGLRANEQNQPARVYPDWGVIERDMVVVDEFVIGFKGLSKKQSGEDLNAYHARATLAPALRIVDAQKRFKASKAVQAIPTDYEKYRKGFMDTFCNRYSELFGRDLSTIEAYDDNGNLTETNGTPHKGRAFYACALRAILKAKNFNDSATSTYIQLCLAHENKGITIKYLGRYDEKDFINPIDINIPTNIKGLGKMTTAVIEKTKTTTKPTTEKTTKPKKAPKDTFDIDSFINGLDPDLQVKFGELMNSESSLTNAVIALINTAKQKSIHSEMQTQKVTVGDEVKVIVTAILDYNSQQTINTNCIVPTYSLINKISEKYYGKSMHAGTVEKTLNELNDDITTRLAHKEIKGLDVAKWNGKYHRKTMDIVIDAIITVLNS